MAKKKHTFKASAETKTFRSFETFGVHYLEQVAKWRPRTVAMKVSDLPRRPPVLCVLSYHEALPVGKETSIGFMHKVYRENKVRGRKKHSIQHYADLLPPTDGQVVVPLSQGLRLLGLDLRYAA